MLLELCEGCCLVFEAWFGFCFCFILNIRVLTMIFWKKLFKRELNWAVKCVPLTLLGLFHFRSLPWGQLTWNTDAINCWFCYFLKYWVSESGFAMSEFFWHQDPILWALLGNPVPRMRFWGPQERPLAPIFDSYAWGEVKIQFPVTPSIVPEVLPGLFFFPPVRESQVSWMASNS